MRCPRQATLSFALLALAGSASVSPAQTRPAAPAAAETTSAAPAAQNAAILAELKAIRALLEKLVAAQPERPAAAGPTPVRVPTDRGTLSSALPTTFVLGRADAPVTMVEFTDLQCPFCRRFTIEAFDQIKRQYIDTGRLRFVSRDLPLDSIHRLARASARVSRCAAEQGKGLEMRQAILANNTKLAVDMFPQFAADLRLDMARFAACTNEVERLDASIQADIEAATSLGFNGTPGFLIGRTVPVGLEGVKVTGAFPFDTFKAVIDAQLAQAAPPARR